MSNTEAYWWYAQDAAVILKDAACELKCRLAALKRLLPRVQGYVDDLDTLSAPASGPPPAALEELQKPFKVIITEVSAAILHSWWIG